MNKTFASLVILLVFLVACNLVGTTTPTDTPAVPVTNTPPGAITPTLCPQATPEWLRVRPVTSPTNELQQTILVDINNGEWVRVTTASGTFEGRPGRKRATMAMAFSITSWSMSTCCPIPPMNSP